MTDLYHVVLKDHENSGYVWDEFYCSRCLNDQITKFQQLEILRQTRASPQYLSRLYPPLINEPECRECGAVFNHWNHIN
ncbi:conserved hypothetical protein [Desulfosarcina cetonica]|uniref:hypothetical protein n=1 Tax=Desulfosarcina cetonica TaxID=90730 RepID=UPI0006D18F3E|nr:hypothetical protein [Desulfosarcina cetonica]VTR66090.1 conserved hypothetical protein [Desulfosarcina cetonica]